MKHTCACIAGLIVLSTLPAFGQGLASFSTSGGGRDGVFQGTATFSLPMFPQSVVTNAPYSGEHMTESSQTLADGTHITRPIGPWEKTWRDSQGRVRTERSIFAGLGGDTTVKDVPAIIEINDPVAGFIYLVDDVKHVAHRAKIAPMPQRSAAMARPANPAAAAGRAMTGTVVSPGTIAGVAGAAGGTAGPLPSQAIGPNAAVRPKMSTEDLGTQMIDGVLVYGTRQTTIMPVGSEGNDRPITTTSETWVSRDLGLTVLSTNYSPLNGTSTTKIANLSTIEPDPALFMVPIGYTIVDETESFTIKWGEK
jgi:hypothetical protein